MIIKLIAYNPTRIDGKSSDVSGQEGSHPLGCGKGRMVLFGGRCRRGVDGFYKSDRLPKEDAQA